VTPQQVVALFDVVDNLQRVNFSLERIH